ncbi:MAG: Dabb family protein [Thermodesulfobacteriota bacterium]
MITHIVLFKLKDPTPEKMEETRKVLERLRDRVPVLRSLEVGVDVLRKERSFDVALTAIFDSLDDLEAYQVHPEHRSVVDYINEVSASRAAVDYESSPPLSRP